MQAAYIAAMAESRAQRPYRVFRRLRLIDLSKEVGGPKELARVLYDRADANDTHLIACIKGRRDVGDELASDLEAAAGKPAGWMDSDPALDAGGPKLSGRAAFVGRQLDAIKEPEAKDRAMILCENFAALAQAGQLQAALNALQALAPVAPAGAPTAPQPLHLQLQNAGGRPKPV